MNEVILVMTNAPGAAEATKMGAALVEQKLAACVNILGACESVYRWEGKIETAREVPLIIKTTRARYAEVETFIRSMHVYEVPEIIVLPVEQGLPAYLDWVRAETAAPVSV